MQKSPKRRKTPAAPLQELRHSANDGYRMRSPLLSGDRYFGLGERLGYTAALLSLLALTCFFISGRAARPRILDSELID